MSIIHICVYSVSALLLLLSNPASQDSSDDPIFFKARILLFAVPLLLQAAGGVALPFPPYSVAGHIASITRSPSSF